MPHNGQISPPRRPSRPWDRALHWDKGRCHPMHHPLNRRPRSLHWACCACGVEHPPRRCHTECHFALETTSKTPSRMPFGLGFAGFFDNIQVLFVLSFSWLCQSCELLLTTCSCRVGVFKDRAKGRSPANNHVRRALFAHF